MSQAAAAREVSSVVHQAMAPAFIQPITYLIPLRYYLVIVRSIFLKGTGIALLWDQVLPMALLGTAILMGSVFAFRKKLE